MSTWKDEWQALAVKQREVMEDLLLDLFPPEFMETHTPYRHIKEFFGCGPWQFRTLEDARDIPIKDLNPYTRQTTDFSDWETMWRTAVSEWMERRGEINDLG